MYGMESMRNMSKGSQSISFVFDRVIGSLIAVDAVVKLHSLVAVCGVYVPSYCDTWYCILVSWENSC